MPSEALKSPDRDRNLAKCCGTPLTRPSRNTSSQGMPPSGTFAGRVNVDSYSIGAGPRGHSAATTKQAYAPSSTNCGRHPSLGQGITVSVSWPYMTPQEVMQL
jgi:hypothetical protein